jgi:hypothetical protein
MSRIVGCIIAIEVQRIPYLCQYQYSKFASCIQNPSPLVFVSKKHGLYGLELEFTWAFTSEGSGCSSTQLANAVNSSENDWQTSASSRRVDLLLVPSNLRSLSYQELHVGIVLLKNWRQGSRLLAVQILKSREEERE